jgi:Tol biopolymer transport system component
LRWIPGIPVITYADDRGGVAEIWGQRITGGAPWQITNLAGGLTTNFDWSPDGKQLVVTRAMRSYDLLLLQLGRT